MLRVLVVDDDPSYRESYRNLVERHGYSCELASTRSDARRALERSAFDVVLLDKRLHGEAGPDDGIDLLEEANFNAAKVILVTAYADERSVQRAFELGAYDYLEKGALTPILLAVKLDRIRELVRLRQTPDERERAIAELWQHLDDGGAHARGRRLEDLVVRLLASVTGFVLYASNLRLDLEEIDAVIRNESPDEYWRKLPGHLLVEAKNWSKPVGRPEVDAFGVKLERRPSASTGFFFAARGFTDPVNETVRYWRSRGVQLVIVDRAALDELVHSSDRASVLKRLHGHALLS
jgi:DNA-binding response OmpR family regulator